jgi:putative PEP-CTERM system TPR-repeat lipoprotein
MTRAQKKAIAALLLVFVLAACNRSPEARRDRYMAKGKELLQKHDYSRAILQFRSAAQAMPKDPEVYYQLSQAYLAAGDIKMSITALRKTLEFNPKHGPARLRMAQFLAMASDPKFVEEARRELQKILEESPQDVEALHSLGFTELKLGQAEDAMQHLARAAALAPQDLMVAISMAEAKLRQKDVAGAEEILRKAAQASPKSADAVGVLGRFYSSQNRWTEAEQAFQRAAALEPENGWALFSLGSVQNRLGKKREAEQTFQRLSALSIPAYKPTHALFLFQEGRRDEAIREFEKLANENPDDRGIRTYLVAAYHAVNRGSDAEKLLTAALKRNPKDSEALLQRAELFIAAGKYAPAEGDLNEVLRFRPDWAEVHYFLAKLHQARGELRIYRDELSKALQLNPGLLPVRLEAAQALLANQEASAALALLDQAPDFQKKLTSWMVQRNWAFWILGDMANMRKGIDAGLAQEALPDLWIQDGLWNLHAGKFAAAQASLEKALHINPEDVRALQALAQIYQAQKQNQTALQKIKEYASQRPNSAPVQEFLGTLLLANGDRQQARAAFDRAKTADPKYARADFLLAEIDVLDGKLDDAKRRIEAVLASGQSATTAHLWLGNLAAMQGDSKAALAHFREVVASDPANAQALNNYAYLLAEVGNEPTEALKYAQKAKELAPEDPEYSDTLGWILYRKGLYPLAISELEQAAATGKNAVWKYHLAMAYAKAGDAARSQAALKAALKMNPSLPEAKMAQDLVSALAR